MGAGAKRQIGLDPIRRNASRRILAMCDGESACRRGSVQESVAGISLCDHPSVQPTWGLVPKHRTSRPCPTLGLAPCGVYRATPVTRGAGALLPHRFTLTCATSPSSAPEFRRNSEAAPKERPPSAVCSLLHFPASHLDWPLASTLLCGAPTFLDPVTP